MAVLLSLLAFLTPIPTCLLLVLVLCKNVRVSLPKAFLVTHIILALLVRPLLDLAATVQLLLPMFSAGAIALPVGLIGFLSAIPDVIQNRLALIFKPPETIFDDVKELIPVHIAEDLDTSGRELLFAFERFSQKADFDEVFQHCTPPEIPTTPPMLDALIKYNYREAVLNLTISNSTQQHVDAINIALIKVLKDIKPSNVFKSSRLPKHLLASFDMVSKELSDIAKNLNLTEVIRDATVPSPLQISFNKLGAAMTSIDQNINFTEIYNLQLSSPRRRKAAKNITSWLEQVGMSQKGIFASPLTWVNEAMSPSANYMISGALILMLVVTLPTLCLRAILRNGCLRLVCLRYESHVSSSQRSVSGWMIIAATSASFSLIPEALFYAAFYIITSGGSQLLLLLLHILPSAPLLIASQMRIAEFDARRDILKDDNPNMFWRFTWCAVVNGIFSTWSTVTTGFTVGIFSTSGVQDMLVVIDLFVASMAILWGRQICTRILKDEQRMLEDRERKRD